MFIATLKTHKKYKNLRKNREICQVDVLITDKDPCSHIKERYKTEEKIYRVKILVAELGQVLPGHHSKTSRQALGEDQDFFWFCLYLDMKGLSNMEKLDDKVLETCMMKPSKEAHIVIQRRR